MIHSQATIERSTRKIIQATYRAQLSAVIELERYMVQQGIIKPEERRVLSREERRNETNGRHDPTRAS